MIHLKEAKDIHLAHFERLEKSIGGSGQAWLRPTRKAAIARFAELGLPTTRHEEWRYTNVAPIAGIQFAPADTAVVRVTPDQLEEFTFGDSEIVLLTFVNGRYSAELSSVEKLPTAVNVGSLREAIDNNVPALETHLARHAGYEDQAFTALNTALMEDGAFVHIPRGTVVESPIHLLFVSTTPADAIVSHPRNLIILDTNSQATIVESYIGLGSGVYFTNVVTELVVNESAVVDHYKIEREADQAFHVGTLHVHQSRASCVTSQTVSLGGRLVRHDIHAVLDGEGGDCTLNGLYMAGGDQHIDNHLVVEHASAHCNSREFFKGILDDRGKGIFSGRIIVRKGAQKTDAKQTNMNLLLSEDAEAQSRPQLEILADDVKCTHGATIGEVSEAAIFYLRTRGITEEAARSLLIYAFARECIARVRIEALRAQLEGLVLARLSHGHLLGEDS